TYGAGSGQESNLSKSEVFFSQNMSREAKEDLSGIMGVCHVLDTGTYIPRLASLGGEK
ncbi:CNGC5-like protein, partial [Trifolium medium]|nr:CNGC5-like protein [Trifolium medium]